MGGILDMDPPGLFSTFHCVWTPSLGSATVMGRGSHYTCFLCFFDRFLPFLEPKTWNFGVFSSFLAKIDRDHTQIFREHIQSFQRAYPKIQRAYPKIQRAYPKIQRTYPKIQTFGYVLWIFGYVL